MGNILYVCVYVIYVFKHFSSHLRFIFMKSINIGLIFSKLFIWVACSLGILKLEFNPRTGMPILLLTVLLWADLPLNFSVPISKMGMNCTFFTGLLE